MIVKHGAKWLVLAEKDGRVLGTHPTKKAAQKQLAAIEASKARQQNK